MTKLQRESATSPTSPTIVDEFSSHDFDPVGETAAPSSSAPLAAGRPSSSSTSSSASSVTTRHDDEASFHLYEKPDTWSDRKSEKIVKYARKRLDKLEVSTSSYENCHVLNHSQAPTLRHAQIEVGDLLGKGAFSAVYSVRQVYQDEDDEDNDKNGRRQQQRRHPKCDFAADQVVIKFLRSKLYQNPAMMAACAGDLCKEGILMSNLHHPNILRVYATAPGGVTGFANGCHDAFFLVLEKLECTLSDRMEDWKKNKVSSTRLGSNNKNKTRSPQRLRRIGSEYNNVGSGSFRGTSSSSSSSSSGQPVTTKKKGFRLFSRRGGRSTSRSDSSNDDNGPPNRINLDERLDAALQLADAVAYLHSQGILHRDIKPDNIGWSSGMLKIFDFDVSRRVPASMKNQYNGVDVKTNDPFKSIANEETLLMTKRVGSPRYMCPECARGEEYNLKADVYTYTLLLHELLTLEKPYDDISNEDHDDFVFYKGLRPTVPSYLSSKLKRLLQRGWSEKLQSRPTMAALTCVLEQELPLLLPPPSKHLCAKEESDELLLSGRTAPLSATSGSGYGSRNGNPYGRQQRRSISKTLAAGLLRRNECVPTLVSAEG